MEISFNPSQALPSGAGETVSRSSDTTPAPEPSIAVQDASSQDVKTLQDQLNNLPDSRPEKVAELKPLCSHLQYPPDQILDSIAHLLAIHLND